MLHANEAVGVLTLDDAIERLTRGNEATKNICINAIDSHHRGIALRREGDLEGSKAALRAAMERAKKFPSHWARINRDLALTMMESLKSGDEAYFHECVETLRESLPAQTNDKIEYEVTVACRGRAAALLGNDALAKTILARTKVQLRALMFDDKGAALLKEFIRLLKVKPNAP